MKELDPKDRGKIALARFLIAYSGVERAMGEAIKAILKVEPANEELVVAAIGDFARKANAIKAGLEQATTLGAQPGTDAKPLLDQKWVEAGTKAMSKALGLNDDRVQLAHGYLSQNEDGSFEVTHLKLRDGKIKNSPQDFSITTLENKSGELETLADNIKELTRQLRSVVIHIPTMDLRFSMGAISASTSPWSPDNS
jgi:hypothetical protein